MSATFEDSGSYEVWLHTKLGWEIWSESSDLQGALAYGHNVPEMTEGESVHLVRVVRQSLGEITRG